MTFSEVGGYEVETRADGTRFATVTMYALALMAAKGTTVAQQAGWSPAKTDAEAHEHGLKLAKEIWPPGDGWTDHQAATRKATLRIDLIEKK